MARSPRGREDTAMHLAARSGNLESVVETISNSNNLQGLLSKKNSSGETPLYVAAEFGSVDLVKEMMKHCDVDSASSPATNGYDPFHIAAKQGHLGVLKVLMEAIPELAMTVDQTNSTALHTAAARGHVEVVKFLLEKSPSLASISRSNCKTPLHSAARNGHLTVVKALLSSNHDPLRAMASKTDKKKQTPLHMAVKGRNVDLVAKLVDSLPCLLNTIDAKGNTALHVASSKNRPQIVEKLLSYKAIETTTVNRNGETALDSAENNGQTAISSILVGHGVQRGAKTLVRATQGSNKSNKDLNRTVTVLKHKVHDHLQHTRQTRRRVRGMTKQVEKMQLEGLNNAINSTTVVAVLIATVAFSAIFTVPGHFSSKDGEAKIGQRNEFAVFYVFDSFALFLSLAVVVVQTSVVVTEKRSKRRLMTVINKLMWLACIMISVAFLALSYVVVGDHGRVLAVGVTFIGAIIMSTTLGTMCCWVVLNRLQSTKLRRKARRLLLAATPASSSGSPSTWSISVASDSDVLNNENYKTVYAI